MSDPADTEIRRAMGDRLRRVRLALGLTQKAIVQNFGVSVTAWSAWESGRNEISLVQLAKIAQRFGFDVNYISLGDMSGLRKGLSEKLDAMETPPETQGSRRGRPRATQKNVP